jgi:hypothetical protein
MAATGRPHKHSPGIYLVVRLPSAETEGHDPMAGIALCMFIALYAFGAELLGWRDPTGQVQLGLFMSFIFGIICGYRTRS